MNAADNLDSFECTKRSVSEKCSENINSYILVVEFYRSPMKLRKVIFSVMSVC